MRSTTHPLTVVIASLFLAFTVACSNSPNTRNDQGAPETGSTRNTPIESVQNLPPELNEKPAVKATPGEAAPQDLIIKDLITGTGAEAIAGKMITVNYVGVAQSTGREFDSTWSRNQPFTFQLGAGKVIPGWDRGIAGMKVGGRRELVIPPELAYGARGAGGAIGSNETLVFIVDLLEVK